MTMDSMMPAWQLVLLQVLTFLGLLVALRLLFSRQLNAALRRLQALQEEALVKEAQLKEELQRAQHERAAEVEQGKEDARRLVEVAQQEAETLLSHAQGQAKQEGQKIVAHGQEEVDKIRAHLASEIEADAIALSTAMVRYLLTDHAKVDFQHHVLQELIQEIGGLERGRFAIHTKTAVVTSSVPLTADEQQGLRRALAEKLGAAVTLEERLDPELITGLVIQLGSLVIDGSLRNRLQKAIPFLRNPQNRPPSRDA
jgi:F-type H+-transporting ATPase subunit delta